MSAVNPITHVYPHGGSPAAWTLPPSKYVVTFEDVSSSDAGRVESGKMYKKRIGRAFAIQLEWAGVSNANAATILAAFSPEYIDVTFLDPWTNSFITKEFYVGNRTAPLYNATLGIWENIAFSIISRELI